jgi:hypothetical protein
MIVVTGSVTARKDSLDEVIRLSLEHVHRSRKVAFRTPCMSTARTRCGWCFSSNGPIAQRYWPISRYRLRANSYPRCSRSPRRPRPSSSTTPPG